jgi:hypothetical protein
MPDLVYGSFAPRRFQFCVEDVAYDWAPSKFMRIDGEDGVNSDSVKTLDLSRKIVTPRPVNDTPWFAYESQSAVFAPTSEATDYHPNPRYLVQQAWRADWQEAYVDLCMRDHFYLLYSLQKAFWIQFDDEMSYECVAMEPISVDRRQFITPTYPIAFHRSSDAEGARQIEHAYFEVYFNGGLAKWEDNPWRFDPEIGLLIFQNAIPSDMIVSIRYLWRAYVRIRNLGFTIAALAQGPYTGFVEFEQVPTPYVVERFDTTMTRPPCRRCPDNKYSDGTEIEECTPYVAPAVANMSEGEAEFPEGYWSWGWSDDGLVVTLANNDNLYAGAFNDDPSPSQTGYIYTEQYNFDLPDDELNRKITRISVVVVAQRDTSDPGWVFSEVRLLKNSQPVGSNIAAMTDLSASMRAYVFKFDLTEDDYGITYADVLNARIGVRVGFYTVTGDYNEVYVNQINMSVCYSEGTDEPPLPGDCGCNVTDKLATATITEQTCTSLKWLDQVNAFNIPTDHYVHGVELMSMVVGANNGCPTSTTSLIKTKLRLKQVGSTFSSWLQKDQQPIPPTDHAIIGDIDATTDKSFGGVNDLWGRPFGAWTPALINSSGLEFETNWSASCNPQLEANWSIAYVYTGTTEHSAGSPGDPTSFAWGSSPQGGLRDYSRGSGTPNYVSLGGTIKIVYTWIGGGDAPAFVQASIYSKARANAVDGPGAAYWSGTVDNGFADDTVIEYVSGHEDSRTKEGTHTVLLNVVGGVAEYTVACSAYSYKSLPTSGGLQVYAGVIVTGTVAPCTLPTKQDTLVRVHHSPVCATNALCHQLAVSSGTWNQPSFKGINCELARTSDGGQNGAYTLLMSDYVLEILKANARIVGIMISGQKRRVGSGTPSGSITFKTHIGSYSGARTGKTTAYPTTDTWSDFVLGGNGDFWDYGSVFAETGVTYPTAIGSQVNSYFTVEMIGSNVPGTFFEFRNLKVTLFFAEVCDGL